MNYNKILKRLVDNIDFNKYDAFSTSKYCYYVNIDGKDLALIWRHYDNKKALDEDYNSIEELSYRVDKSIVNGARLPMIHSAMVKDNYLFQIQDRVTGKKIGYYETLATKTTISNFVDFLRTIDVMSEQGIGIDQGYNCLVDDNGEINVFDYYLTQKKAFKVNSKPWIFKTLLFREPEYLTEDNIKTLRKIIEKWIKACVLYFSDYNLSREEIYYNIYETIKDYSFVSIDEKQELINRIIDNTLQKTK